MARRAARFEHAVRDETFMLFEGAVIERLRRDPNVQLDPDVLHAGLVHDPAGRTALERIYRSYLDVGRRYDVPMVVLTPTWRASPERLSRAGLGDVDQVSADAFRFLAALRESYGAYARRVWIGGLMGCRGDAYEPREALAVEEAHRFHAAQAQALAQSGVDFTMGATLPALSEAQGMGAAMADAGLPYLLSFVVRPTGTLLDGTPLHESVERIDAALSPPPVAYVVNCVHPSVFAEALRSETVKAPSLRGRVLGLQANTSAKPPEELDGAASLEGEDPETFGQAMVALLTSLGVVALGGCCGTDDRHIASIARGVAAA